MYVTQMYAHTHGHTGEWSERERCTEIYEL